MESHCQQERQEKGSRSVSIDARRRKRIRNVLNRKSPNSGDFCFPCQPLSPKGERGRTVGKGRPVRRSTLSHQSPSALGEARPRGVLRGKTYLRLSTRQTHTFAPCYKQAMNYSANLLVIPSCGNAIYPAFHPALGTGPAFPNRLLGLVTVYRHRGNVCKRSSSRTVETMRPPEPTIRHYDDPYRTFIPGVFSSQLSISAHAKACILNGTRTHLRLASASSAR